MGKFVDYRGKVAAITGGGSGIGRALALGLVDEGCRVALSDMNPETLAETKEMVQARGGEVITHRVDVSQVEEFTVWAEAVIREMGSVNYIFNNAGLTVVSPVDGGDLELIERTMDVNFWGVVHGTRTFLPLIKRAGCGAVVNFSSVFGIAAMPTQSAYNASKFAVRGYTESLSTELMIEKSPVRAICVFPGGVKTNISLNSQRDDVLDQSEAATGRTSKVSLEKHLTLSADSAAQTIIGAVANGQKRVLVGKDAKAIDWLVRLFPSHYSDFILKQIGAY